MANTVRLAHKYDPEKHRNKVIGWFMSEKLDGVRAIWDGHYFITRNGNKLAAPWRMVSAMQKLKLGNRILDGELYLGRGAFNDCSGIVRRKDDEWFGIEFHVFDMYTPGVDRVYYHRYHDLQELTRHKERPTFLRVVEQFSVRAASCIWDKHAEYTSLGGEGVMLTNPGAVWTGTRTKDLLKVKSFIELEATVFGHEEGQGKYVGMVGALQCRLANGRVFYCGSGLTDSDRVNDDRFLGKTITVKCFEVSKDGIPRFPIFKGVRHDTTA